MSIIFDIIGAMPSVTTMIKLSATGTAVFLSLYAYFVFTKWDKDFAGQRLGRTAKDCPSNSQRPDVAR